MKKAGLVSIKIKVCQDLKKEFTSWQAVFNTKIATFPGFVSLEFLAPTNLRVHWLVTQRFLSVETAFLWLQSDSYKELFKRLKKLAEGGLIEVSPIKEVERQEGVMEVIITRISPEKEQLYLEWSGKIHQVEASFPGFLGIYVQSPTQNKNYWITFLQFDSEEHLDFWMHSSERKKLLKESAFLSSSFETHRVISPYSTWFAAITKETETLPSVWKQTLVVLLVLFPIVMLELKYLSPFTVQLGLSLSTFIGNTISVFLIAFPMMPMAVWCLGWWLDPLKKGNYRLNFMGIMLILILYLFEIWFFS